MELRPLVKKLGSQETEIGGVSVQSGHLGDRKVVAIVTDIDTQLGFKGTERPLAADEFTSVGITGAVDNTTPIVTLVLPGIVVDSLTGVEYRPTPMTAGITMQTMDTFTTDLDEIGRVRAQGVVTIDMDSHYRRKLRVARNSLAGPPRHQQPDH